MIMNKKKIQPYTSIFVIADTASSHEGQVQLAQKMADAVKQTKADAVNYQMFNADNLLVPNHHKYSSFKELQFSESEWHDIIGYARSIGLFVIAEIFDEKSFELAQKLDISVYKIPTSDLTNPCLLQDASNTEKLVILSVGAATESEIDYAVKAVTSNGNEKIILMHGFQGFPTTVEDTNFSQLIYLKEKFHYQIGFADHVDASSPHALLFPLIAIGYGAGVIEKHITMDRSQRGRDYYSALNPDEFTHMISLVRELESAYGATRFGRSKAEKKYRQLMKKMVVAGCDITEGYHITVEDILFRRSDEEGIIPSNYEKVLGCAKRFIPKFSVIREEDVT